MSPYQLTWKQLRRPIKKQETLLESLVVALVSITGATTFILLAVTII